jgi:hypothetical protein
MSKRAESDQVRAVLHRLIAGEGRGALEEIADRLAKGKIGAKRAAEEATFAQSWDTSGKNVPYWGSPQNCGCEGQPMTARCRQCRRVFCAACQSADTPCKRCGGAVVTLDPSAA